MEVGELLKFKKEKEKKVRDRIRKMEKRKSGGKHLILPRGSIMEHFLVHHQ